MHYLPNQVHFEEQPGLKKGLKKRQYLKNTYNLHTYNIALEKY